MAIHYNRVFLSELWIAAFLLCSNIFYFSVSFKDLRNYLLLIHVIKYTE